MNTIYIVVGYLYNEDYPGIEGCYLSKISAEKRKLEIKNKNPLDLEKSYDYISIETHPILN